MHAQGQDQVSKYKQSSMPSTGLRCSFSESSLQLGSWGGGLLVGVGDGYGYGFDVAYFMGRLGL